MRTLKDLLKALKKAGLPHNPKTIRRWEKEGKLVCPRSTTNRKIMHGNEYFVRQFTDGQIEGIVKAFSPGGEGHWQPSSAEG